GESLSRQGGGAGGSGGGVGTRGPGETKIETDRRRIRARKSKLTAEIKLMKTARDTKRQERVRNKVPSVAIAGYTNAGKSSLLNRLTGAGVLVENALFATLDPTVRRASTPSGREFTLADTVGFVRHLPHQLVEAFRSTLEEVQYADLILHVVDGAHPDPESQLTAVRSVFAEVGAAAIPEIVVVNKADIADPLVLGRLQRREKHCVLVENALFATLDPTVRKGQTPNGRALTLTDTVGFVRHLPHQLVEAFRSTLEEVAEADLILHVIDGSDPDPESQLTAVREVFAEVGADKVAEIVVINKADVADPIVLARLHRLLPHSVVVSAHTGAGFDELLAAIEADLPQTDREVYVLMPYSRGDLVARIHELGEVYKTEHLADGTALHARVPLALAAELERFEVAPA
ncbi:MAG: GTPase HflX, partial [Streptosporangiaceae bacterium]